MTSLFSQMELEIIICVSVIHMRNRGGGDHKKVNRKEFEHEPCWFWSVQKFLHCHFRIFSIITFCSRILRNIFLKERCMIINSWNNSFFTFFYLISIKASTSWSEEDNTKKSEQLLWNHYISFEKGLQLSIRIWDNIQGVQYEKCTFHRFCTRRKNLN